MQVCGSDIRTKDTVEEISSEITLTPLRQGESETGCLIGQIILGNPEGGIFARNWEVCFPYEPRACIR